MRRTSNETPPAQLPQLLSATEVAGLLGTTRRTVWRMVSDGRLPKPLLVCRGRWRADQLAEWIESKGKQGT